MGKKNLVLGIATGVALLSITALMVKRRRQSADSCRSESFTNLIHDGKRLAEKSRHKAEHRVSAIRNDH